MLKVSYKTAWYLSTHPSRNGRRQCGATGAARLKVDDTDVGRHRQGVGSGNRIHKSMVPQRSSMG